MTNTEPPIYDDRVVAFVDILGFRSLVASLPKDSSLHKHLHGALSTIKSIKSFTGDSQTAQKELEASVFSDSIVISGAPSELFTVIWTCIGLQAKLLAFGVLTRGGISRGPTHHQEDLLYGEGMIRAYDLESKSAIYPRVVVDPVLAQELPEIHRYMLTRQAGCHYPHSTKEMKTSIICVYWLVALASVLAAKHEVKEVYIIGYVEKPESYLLLPDQDLLQLILMSGGPEAGAGGPKIQRSENMGHGKMRMFDVDLRKLISEKKDFKLQHGDRISFHSGGPLGGWVSNPKALLEDIRKLLKENTSKRKAEP